MPERRWTILIVPSDNEGTRSFDVTERGRKTLVWGLGAAAGMVVAAVAYLFTPYATPAARLAQAESARLRTELDGVDARLTALTDTLTSLGKRDHQLRLFVGMAADSIESIIDPAPGNADPGTAVAAVVPGNALRRPFAGRLAFGNNTSDRIDEMTRRAVALAQSFDAMNDSLTLNLERIANTPSIMPTTGWLTSHFTASRFHPILHLNRPHEGIDVSAPMGAPIVAPARGRVQAVGYEAGYGNTFEIDHGNGIVTRFAHCSRILVRNGQIVSRGQVIATVGNTGLTIGPHLHYEVHVNGKPVDPLRYVLPDKIAD